MRERAKRIFIPFYDSYFEIVVSPDIAKSASRKSRQAYLGEQDVEGEYSALNCYLGGNFSIFFTYKDLNHNTIAHEIFHATMRMAERTGVEFKPDNHEPFAYLQGYLAQVTYSFLKKHRIRVKGS